MAQRQTLKGNNFGPIIKLEDGDRIICRVLAIRGPEGDRKGDLIDCELIDGTPFSLNGHTILVNKINEVYIGGPIWMDITRAGTLPSSKGSPAIYYTVDWLRTTSEELAADKDERQALEDSDTLVKRKIAELPPRE
jgi:hypothetical protein